MELRHIDRPEAVSVAVSRWHPTGCLFSTKPTTQRLRAARNTRSIRKSHDLFATWPHDFHTVNYIDDLRFEPSTPRFVLNESKQGVSIAPHVAKDVAEATFKISDLKENENDK